MQIDPWEQLATMMKKSGCAKKQVAAGTYFNGGKSWLCYANYCEHEGPVCPRLRLPSGVGYDLCNAQHAEANLVKMMLARGLVSDGIMWVAGHYYVCEPCAGAAKLIGVKEIRVCEEP